MVAVFRFIYFFAALLSVTAGTLVIASLFIQDRAPQSTESLGIHLAVSAVFLGGGVLFLGIQRHVAAVAAMVYGQDGAAAREPATHVTRLLAYLLAGGAFICAALGVMTYSILARIDQGFAVFG